MKRTFATFLYVVGVLSLPMERAAEAGVLCTNPSGQISLRDASCRPGEQLVDVASLGLAQNDAYTYHSARPLDLDSGGRVVAGLSVPRGNYVVNTWVGFESILGTGGDVIACYLLGDSTNRDAAEADTGAHGEGTLAFHSTFVATEDNKWILLECRTPYSFLQTQVRELRLTAMRVNSITVQ